MPTRPFEARRRILATLSSLLFIAITQNAGNCDTPQSIRQQLADKYAAMDVAFRDRDVDAALAFYSPKCRFVDNGDTMSLAQERKLADRQLRHAVSAQSQTQVISFSLSGSTATVVETQLLHETDKQNGKPLIVEERERSRDTWLRNKNGWQIDETVTLSEETFVDGKRYKR